MVLLIWWIIVLHFLFFCRRIKRWVVFVLPLSGMVYGLVLPPVRSDTEIVYQPYYSLHIVFSHGLVAGQTQFLVVD